MNLTKKQDITNTGQQNATFAALQISFRIHINQPCLHAPVFNGERASILMDMVDQNKKQNITMRKRRSQKNQNYNDFKILKLHIQGLLRKKKSILILRKFVIQNRAKIKILLFFSSVDQVAKYLHRQQCSYKWRKSYKINTKRKHFH